MIREHQRLIRPIVAYVSVNKIIMFIVKDHIIIETFFIIDESDEGGVTMHGLWVGGCWMIDICHLFGKLHNSLAVVVFWKNA